MNSDIESLLEQIGPCLSSRIASELKKRGMSAEAARKRISRAGGKVRRLLGLSFPNRESFLFLEGEFGNSDFLESLARELKQTGSSYGRALIGLTARAGSIPAKHFPVASGLPVERAIGQVPHSVVEEKLQQLGLVSRSAGDEEETFSLWDHSSPGARRRAAIAVENITLGIIKVWLTKLGFSSQGALEIRSSESLPAFGQFRWDLVGPSYLACLMGYEQGRVLNGFVVGDILLDRNITSEDLRPFFAKWEVLRNQRRKTRFQPMFIADQFEPEALKELRRKGCIVAMPATLFGEEASRHLQSLIGTIEHAAAAIANNPQAVFELISKITKLEGAALNLRGVVLELMIAHLFKLQGYEIEIRQRIVSEKGEQAEIDVKALNRKEVVCVECKGKGPNALVSAAEIKQWMDKTLVRIKSWFKLTPTLPQSRRFEFYTSTGFTDDAKALITQIDASHVQQPIAFFSGINIVSKLRDQRESALVDIFRDQFMRK